MIHKAIKEFWASKNRVSGPFGDRSPIYYVWYIRVDRDPFGLIIAHDWKDDNHVDYFFDGEMYSEAEMLRVIKLSVFL